MPDFDTASAAEAIRNAVAQDNEPTATQDQAPQTESTVPTGSDESNQVKDYDPGLFHGIDPNTLTPELKTIFDSMQKSYTQKSQEVATQRKEIESLGNMDSIKQSVEFVNALQDPENLVQLHQELSDYLQNMGYTKAEAEAASASTIQEKQNEAFVPDNTAQDFDFDTDPNDDLRRELNELKQFRQQYEEEKLQSDIEAALTRQESMIRQANPHYTDTDVERIYNLSYAYGGSLTDAQQAYEDWRNSIIGTYADSKASVSDGVTTPTTGGSGQTPDRFDSFEDAHSYAKRRLAAIESMGGLDE